MIQRNVGMLPKQKQVAELLAALRGLQETVMAGIRRVGDDSPGHHWTEGRKPQILTQNDDGETLEGAIFTLVSTSETQAEVLTTTHYDDEYGYFFEMVRARARKAVKCGLGKVGPGGKPPMVKISGMHPCVGGLRQMHAERADGRGVMGSCCPAQVRARAEERLLMPQETGEVAALVRGAWSTRYDMLEMCEYSVRFTARNGRYAPCTVGGCGGRLALCRAWLERRAEEMPEDAYALYLLHRRPAEAAQYVPETTGAIEVAGRGRGGGAGRGAGRGKGDGGGKGGKGGGGTPPARMITCAGCGNRARDMRRDSAGGDYCGDCWAKADRMQEELEEEGAQFYVDAAEQQQEDAEMSTAVVEQQEGDASATRATEVGAAIEGGGEGGGELRSKAAAAAEARLGKKAASPGAAGSGRKVHGQTPYARGSPSGSKKGGGGSAPKSEKSAKKQARLEAAAALAAGAQKGGAQ